MKTRLAVTNGTINIKLDLDGSGHCCGIGVAKGLDMGLVTEIRDKGGWVTETIEVKLVNADKEIIFNTIREEMLEFMKGRSYAIMSFSDAVGEKWTYAIGGRKRTVGFSLSDFAEALGVKPDRTIKSPASGNMISIYSILREHLEEAIIIEGVDSFKATKPKNEEKEEKIYAGTPTDYDPVWTSQGTMSRAAYQQRESSRGLANLSQIYLAQVQADLAQAQVNIQAIRRPGSINRDF